jgi:hypothetical protein
MAVDPRAGDVEVRAEERIGRLTVEHFAEQVGEAMGEEVALADLP